MIVTCMICSYLHRDGPVAQKTKPKQKQQKFFEGKKELAYYFFRKGHGGDPILQLAQNGSSKTTFEAFKKTKQKTTHVLSLNA